MSIRREVYPFLPAVAIGLVLVSFGLKTMDVLCLPIFFGLFAIAGVLCVYLLYFIRDPERTLPTDENVLLAGLSTFLGYFPGKRIFTFQAKSSEVNQHNKIIIEGWETRCLVCQIVGPVCRRVVYWPPYDKTVDIGLGERIGMMKFGSRLDMYFPASDIELAVKPGDRVCAGVTIVGRLRNTSTKKE